MKTDHYISKKGFSLVELLVALVIFMIVIAASFSTYITFVNSTNRESALATMNSDVMIALNLMERDIRMAGFGLPEETRVASDNNCNVGDEAFCKDNSDRLFVADGWEILRDFTDNQENDGQIPTSPTDYYSKISDAKSNGGYKASLSSDVSAGATSITVNVLNIDSADERADPDTPNGEDIKDNHALIIADKTNFHVDGHRIRTVSSNTVNFLSKDPLQNAYLATDSSVVPAIAWYVRNSTDGEKYPDGTDIYWLYRNETKVIPDIDAFQIRYGYDAKNDGIECDSVIPPQNLKDCNTGSPTGNNDKPDGQAFSFADLRVVEVQLSVKFMDKREPGKSQIIDYKRSVELRN